eukprot:scaffold8847_cov112-Isochrysis_galbana.AAC.10
MLSGDALAEKVGGRAGVDGGGHAKRDVRTWAASPQQRVVLREQGDGRREGAPWRGQDGHRGAA